ncbi:hypothetical protein KPHVMX_250346 [Klebsiella pneumoniae]|nr:hypothetical protein KPHVMX_250346 [Klebsiella pneumoniae]
MPLHPVPEIHQGVFPYVIASACAFTTTERALHGFTITSEDLSGVVNALTCCALVSSEVSHRTATMVSRCRACRAWLAHSGYPLGHVPRSPRTAIGACAIRRMLSHLEAHSAI